MPGNGKTTSGIWLVANLAALAQLTCSLLDDGTPIWVQSEQANFTFLASSAQPVDGVNVIAPIVGAPRAGNAGARFVRAGVTFDAVQTALGNATSPVEIGPAGLTIDTDGTIHDAKQPMSGFKTADYGARAGEVVEIDGSVSHTVTLPDAATCRGESVGVANTTGSGAGTWSIHSLGGLINGAATDSINGGYAYKEYLSDGTKWIKTAG